MHKRSYKDFQIYYHAVRLPDSFPLRGPGKGMHSPSEKPVSFLHYHNCLEIGYCYGGNGIFFVEDKVMPFTKGDASIIFKGEMHIAQSSEANPSLWKFVYLDPIKLLNELSVSEQYILSEAIKGGRSFANVLSREKHPMIAGLILDILSEFGNLSKNHQSVVKAQIWLLLLQLSRLTSGENQDGTLRERAAVNRITHALNYISNNYMHPIEIKTLASVCGLSEPHFRRLFKSAFMTSPSEYIFRVRIKMAGVLLGYTDTSVLDISEQVGFDSLSSFYRHFKRLNGLCPREWRKKHFSKRE